MRYFRAGKYERERVPPLIRRFSPTESLHSLDEVRLDDLLEMGKTLILLDVDNTLMPWRASDIPDTTSQWVERAKSLGFKLCVLSNTRNPERLQRICTTLDIPFIRDRFKPSRRMYQLALEQFHTEQDQAVMLGDQLLTDVWGANRSGIDAIWIKPIHKKEFVGTSLISRNIEKAIGHFLYKYFQVEQTVESQRPGLFRSNIFAQLVKFAVVGAAATMVDLGLHYLLLFKAQINGVMLRDITADWLISLGFSVNRTPEGLREAAFGPLKIGPVLLAILVSYLLNRLWTFDSRDQKITAKQVGKFYIIALVGLVISVTVSTLVNVTLKGSAEADWTIASLAGMVCGFLWNFNGQRLWTFRQGKSDER